MPERARLPLPGAFAGERLEDILRLLDDPQLQGTIILATELSLGHSGVRPLHPAALVFLDACRLPAHYDYCTMNNLDAVQVMGYLLRTWPQGGQHGGSSVP